MPQVTVRSIEPWLVDLPECDPVPSGELTIVLPPVQVTLGTLDALPGCMVTSSVPCGALTVILHEPTAVATVAARLLAIRPHLAHIHAIAQRKVDEHGALFGPGELPPELGVMALANTLGKGQVPAQPQGKSRRRWPTFTLPKFTPRPGGAKGEQAKGEQQPGCAAFDQVHHDQGLAQWVNGGGSPGDFEQRWPALRARLLIGGRLEDLVAEALKQQNTSNGGRL